MNLVLESERLLLRPVVESDLDSAIEILTDPVVMRYVADTYTEDRVIREMPLFMRRCAGGCIGIWTVLERATDEKLGSGILLPMPIDKDDTDWDLVVGDEVPDGDIEVGYLLKPSAWGKGYAKEICDRLLKFAFEDSPLEEIVAVTDPENVASQNVLRKCGMVEEGMRRAYAEQCPGFRITRQQWLEHSQDAH